MDKPESEYHKLQWAATGERLTKERFLAYRKQGGLVLIHANTEANVRAAVVDPLTMFASDGFDIRPHAGHPRSASTNSRVLGRYVREQKALSLMQALRKMTLMPAQRIQARVPQMLHKGRLSPGRMPISWCSILSGSSIAPLTKTLLSMPRECATFSSPDSSCAPRAVWWKVQRLAAPFERRSVRRLDVERLSRAVRYGCGKPPGMLPSSLECLAVRSSAPEEAERIAAWIAEIRKTPIRSEG
jgi:hypothetical protein